MNHPRASSDASAASKPHVLLAYHFFHPDDVVSACLFSDLALGLTARGWRVTALTSDRSWSDPGLIYPAHDLWKGVAIERVHRPKWNQARPGGRLANSGWMLAAWTARAMALGPFDAVVVGSDPAFAALLFLPLRHAWPRAALAHWCYDVYPEAIIADGAGRSVRSAAIGGRLLMKMAYMRCDAIVDLGPRMRERLAEYGGPAERHTVTPWALVEPADAPRAPDSAARSRLFGAARIGVLYSGTLGRAHDFRTFLELARACRRRLGNDVAFCFVCRGHRADELRQAIGVADANIRLAEFCDQSELDVQLEGADVHLLSLQAAWSGLVVPSKFFGSLAVGRPVIYAGAADSDIARWIGELDVGHVVTSERIVDAVAYLERLAASPEALHALQGRARRAYDRLFRRELAIDAWDQLLRRLSHRSPRERPNTEPVQGRSLEGL